MAETFTALLLAHVLADFVFQTRWMVVNKRKHAALGAHVGVVLATALAATGSLHPALFALALSHLLIDLGKSFAPARIGPFMADQAAHLAVVTAVAFAFPDLYAAGLWPRLPGDINLPALMALVSGAVLATRAGGFAIGLLMDPWAREIASRHPDQAAGLANGGLAIGHLERGLIFLLVLTGQAEGIGFLIAAKSVLRFGTVGDDRAVSEYVIIGTLASFGWAIAASFGTVWLMDALPVLGIPDLSP